MAQYETREERAAAQRAAHPGYGASIFTQTLVAIAVACLLGMLLANYAGVYAPPGSAVRHTSRQVVEAFDPWDRPEVAPASRPVIARHPPDSTGSRY